MCVKNLKDIIASRLEILKGDMNVSNFAAKCGIKQPVMDRYIKAAKEPKVEMLMKICDVFGCSIDWLTGYSEIRSPNLGLSESEWQRRAIAAEQKLEKYDGFVDMVVRGHEEMLKGIQGIAAMRKL